MRGATIVYLARTSGAAAVRRALPTYLGLFVVAVILFTGNGMRASDVVALALGVVPARAALLGAWLLLGLPAARAALAAPAAFWIRVWPVPRAEAVSVMVLLLAAIELPWIILWTKGGGALAGAAAAAIAIAGHGLLLGRPRTALEVGAAGLWAAAVWWMPSPALALAAAAPAVALGVRRAWIAAPERVGVRRAARLVQPGRSATVAWARAHLALMVRGQRAGLGRALWFVAGGALGAKLAAVSNGVGDPARLRALWRVAAALTAAWGASGLIGGAQRAEAEARWLLDVCGASARVRRLGPWLALVTIGGALGALAGGALGLVGAGGGVAALALAADGAIAAAAGAAIAAAGGRWAIRGDGSDGGRLLGAIIAGSAALAPLAFSAGAPGLLLAAAGSLALPDGRRAAEPKRAAGPPSLAGEA